MRSSRVWPRGICVRFIRRRTTGGVVGGCVLSDLDRRVVRKVLKFSVRVKESVLGDCSWVDVLLRMR